MTNEVPEYVNAEDINNLYLNQQKIRTMLDNYGITIDILDEINISSSVQYVDVRSIYNLLEHNYDLLSQNKYMSQYYGSSTIHNQIDNEPTFDNVQRWYNIQSDMYNILSNVSHRYSAILTKQNIYLCDKNQRIIMIGSEN